MRIFILGLIILFGQLNAQEYSDYRIRYDNFAEDDPRAFEYLNPYISIAKKENNNRELFQAYKDAIHFSSNDKLAYADSAIIAALRTKDSDIIGTAYLTKGTVYYFNYRKFQPALDEYLKAWKFTEHTDNKYLHYKNLYHIGVVKSYLGDHLEALEIFKKCNVFFGTKPTSTEAPNKQFNRKKGYLNTLHQTAICLIEVARIDEAKILIKKGLEECGAQADFYLERSYFHQLNGIIAYREQRDSTALSALNTALPGLEKKNNFTAASLVYFYKGKIHARLDDETESIRNFAKVDSIFVKYNFVLPTVRESYEWMINYFHKDNNREKELYYTKQLLKVDSALTSDFKYLAGKIHKEYDTGDLLASKKRLEHSVSTLYTIGWFVALLIVAFFMLLIFRKDKNNIASEAPPSSGKNVRPSPHKIDGDNPLKVPDAVAAKVLAKLEILERKKFYLEKGISLHKLAPQLQTNSSYLSKIIKDYKGCHFNAYIKQQRIRFITDQLRESRLWRNYSLETLATECGFGDRTNFSNAFLEYNHIKPLDFIRQLNEESHKEGGEV